MRRGKTRLQGYYGGNLVFWMNGKKDVFTYGNEMSTTYPTPPTTDFQSIAGLPYSNTSPRTTEHKYGSELGFGLRGFIGAEYFILPKISLGGEFGWGLGFSKSGASSTTTTAVNAGVLETTTTEGGTASSFKIDVDNNPMGIGSSGAILIHFHF
ncbi:MAG TPA: hypothetical protein VI731_04435, partial [Bacteroidia bacterium]|nr:hypothetical protein [Bacteroidia bacterium]